MLEVPDLVCALSQRTNSVLVRLTQPLILILSVTRIPILSLSIGMAGSHVLDPCCTCWSAHIYIST